MNQPHRALNNYAITDNSGNKDEFLARCPEWATYVFGGVEKAPTTGHVHLQVFAQSYKTMRQINKKYGYHIELCVGTPEQNIAYCGKDHDTFTWGVLSKNGQGARNDISEIMHCLRDGGTPADIMDRWPGYYFRYPHHVERVWAQIYQRRVPVLRKSRRNVVLHYGPSGSNKTRSAVAEIGDRPFYRLSNQDNTMWWKGYCGENIVLLDDFKGGMKMNTLLGILDPWYNSDVSLAPSVLVRMAADTVIITSTMHPSEWYYGQDITELLRRITYIRKIPNSFPPVSLSSITKLTSPFSDVSIGNAFFQIPKEIWDIVNDYCKWF